MFKYKLKENKLIKENLNTHKINLNFGSDKQLRLFISTPTFAKMLAPNQMKLLKVGNNVLSVNNVSLNGLQRMESMGLYQLIKENKLIKEEAMVDQIYDILNQVKGFKELGLDQQGELSMKVVQLLNKYGIK